MMESKKTRVYVVVFYTSFHKENEWMVPKVFLDLEMAKTYANQWSLPDSRRQTMYTRSDDVVPNSDLQKVILDQDCSFSDSGCACEGECHPMCKGRIANFRNEADWKANRIKALQLEKAERNETPWDGLSWTPRVAIIETELCSGIMFRD
jgi:hypothetical protein